MINLYIRTRSGRYGAPEWREGTGVPFKIPGCPFHFAVTVSLESMDHYVATNVETGRVISWSYLSIDGAIEDATRRWNENPEGITKGIEESEKAPPASEMRYAKEED